MGSMDRRVLYAFLVVLACLLALGSWQLLRGFEKRAMLDRAAAAGAAQPVNLSNVQDLELAATEYRSVTLSGVYQAERQFLWDNRVFQGRAGFEVIIPVLFDDGSFALVNRGWVPVGVRRENLPNISLPRSVDGKTVSIEGLFSRPSRGFASGDAFESDSNWPKILQYFDYSSMATSLGNKVIAGVVQPQRVGEPALGAEFYQVNWQPTDAIGPARHYGYAAQWWTMALVLTLLFFKYGFNREESD